MPDGRAEIRAARPQSTFDGFIGLLAGKAKRTLTVEDSNRVAVEGWVGVAEDRIDTDILVCAALEYDKKQAEHPSSNRGKSR